MKRINLIPGEAKKITPEKWLKSYLFKSNTSRAIAVLVIVIIASNAWQASSILRYRFAITHIKKQVSSIRAKITDSQNTYAGLKSERETIANQTKAIEARLSVLRTVSVDRIAWAKLLAKLSHLVPQKLWINKVSMNKDMVTLAGVTFDNSIVSNFMSRLDASGYFKDTNFNYTQKSKIDEKPVISFEITTCIVSDKALRGAS